MKLIDFGIANAIQKERTSVTLEQQIGTVNYMSPEAIVDTHGGSQVDASGNVKPHIKVGVALREQLLSCSLQEINYQDMRTQ